MSIPKYLKRSQIDYLLKEILPADRSLSELYRFDFSNLSFAEPSGIALFASIVQYLISKRCGIVIYGLDEENEAIRYLNRCGLSDFFNNKDNIKNHTVDSSTLLWKDLANSESHVWLENNLVSWLSCHLKYNTEQLRTLESNIQELFRNVDDHSTQKIGYLFSQFYPYARNPDFSKIVICVSDIGVGIPTTTRKKIPELNDGAALEWAVGDGHSSASKPNNRGVGLFELTKNIVDNCKSCVHIISGKAMLSLNGTTDKGKVATLTSLNGTYPGTLVEIELYVRSFRPDPIDEDVINFEF
ncbi:hypothetical protein [Entomobacter blattae]|uniref:hypothetical protein n=1 Tax=Entomobacter blattae TaxID=2762277 RepID=UPI00193C8502|nr:hypothetical protein [Entomobacter blattae]